MTTLQRVPGLHRALATASLLCAGLHSLPAWAAAEFSVGDAAAVAGRNTIQLDFTVTRGGDTGYSASVDVATADGTALAGRDYTAVRTTLVFLPGQTTAKVSVPVNSRAVPRERSFTLQLSNAVAQPGGFNGWAAAGQAPVAAYPEGMAVADLNGDGKPDLVLPSTSSASAGLTVLRNDTPTGAATATLTTSAVLSMPFTPMRPLAVDLNRDGRPDLVAPSGDTNRAQLLINTTAAGAPVVVFTGSTLQQPDFGFCTDVDAADFDGDGLPDLVFASPGSVSVPGTNRVFVWRNGTPAGAGTPQFSLALTANAHTASTQTYAQVVRALDVDGDGRPDLAVGHLLSRDVTVLINTTVAGGPIRFAAPVVLAAAFGASSLAVGDVDGDGRPDLVTAENDLTTGSTFSVRLNRTAGPGATPSFTLSTLFGGAPHTVQLRDMDGDGQVDVVLTNLLADSSANGALDIYRNRTPAGAAVPVLSRLASLPLGDEPHALAIADFNGDGRLDLAGADFSGSTAAQTWFAVPLVVGASARIVDASGRGSLQPRR